MKIPLTLEQAHSLLKVFLSDKPDTPRHCLRGRWWDKASVERARADLETWGAWWWDKTEGAVVGPDPYRQRYAALIEPAGTFSTAAAQLLSGMPSKAAYGEIDTSDPVQVLEVHVSRGETRAVYRCANSSETVEAYGDSLPDALAALAARMKGVVD